jgi:hypothetical protein
LSHTANEPQDAEVHPADAGHMPHGAAPADTAGGTPAICFDASPWGIASGAEHAGKYPAFLPLLRQAGVTWLRYFPEWQTVQPRPGEWNWDWSDGLVAAARANGIRVAGVFLYFAPWASSDGGTRGFPVKDMQMWRDYVRATVARYRDDIQYWEVWNECNSPAFNRNGTPRDYADLVREAYVVAKQVAPDCKIGLTCAAFDLHYFDQVITAGATGHFDYICVHPYNSMGYVFGSEPSFLAMTGHLRRMLAAHNQSRDIELWLTEIGLTTTEDPPQLQRQAEALVKGYVLGLVQGFKHFFWFEACGPKYGEGVHAILRDDLTPYPAYPALQTMTAALGPTPAYVGWTNLDGCSYGFVFENRGQAVLVTWAARPEAKACFAQPVTVTDIAGMTTTLPAGADLLLPTTPLFIGDIPASVAGTARRNASQCFPWVPDYGQDNTVWCRLGPTNEEHGLRQGNNNPRSDGLTVTGMIDGVGYRSTDLRNNRPFIYFDVDSRFASWGDRDFEITVVARRARPDQPTVLTLVYESKTGYHEYGKRTPTPGLNSETLFESEAYRAPELWYLEPGTAWQEHTWRIHDACFIQKWGWSFEVNVEMSPGDVWVREVRVWKVSA